MKEIQVPDHECGECQFFNIGEDPVGFCSIYDRNWQLDDENEYMWHDNNSPKPEFCRANHVVVYERTPASGS